jgi:hypothetical protein
MIFIDPLSKLHTRKELKHSLRHNNGKNTQISRDKVDLSDDANYLNEFSLSSDGVYSLTAEMSCTVLILQAAIKAICGKELLIRSIQEINLPSKEWQLIVQPPPIEKKSTEALYSDKHPEKDSDPFSYKLLIPVLSKDDKRHEFQLALGCNRLFAKKHDWPIPPKKITADSVSAPYTSHFIAQLAASIIFEFDDDGEPDQLKELQPNTYSNNKRSTSTNEFETAGLRIWLETQNNMTLYILGDTNLGAIFVDNIAPQPQETHKEENTIAKHTTAHHLDIEV